eukprot:jgi/Ulvmu1/12253/UM086_0046.1
MQSSLSSTKSTVAFRTPHILSARNASKHRLVTMAASRIAYVKGDPENKVLGDCPFCHRVLLTLQLKGLEYEQEYIDFSKKPDWLFEKSPEGKVPVIDDGGEWIADSGDICAYLDKKYADYVMGEGQIPGVAEKFFPSFVGFLKSSGDDAVDKEAALVDQLKQLDAYLAENGPFLGGDEMNAADAMLVPRLYHASVALPHFKAWSFPEELAALNAYVERCKAHPAFKATDYGADMILNGWRAHGLADP